MSRIIIIIIIIYYNYSTKIYVFEQETDRMKKEGKEPPPPPPKELITKSNLNTIDTLEFYNYEQDILYILYNSGKVSLQNSKAAKMN